MLAFFFFIASIYVKSVSELEVVQLVHMINRLTSQFFIIL